VGSTLDDVRAFPVGVREEMGYALHLAQMGDKHVSAKPLKGFGGAATLEICTDYDSDTFRTIYSVKFNDAVYVLHAFQKKSKRRSSTPKREIELARQRLQKAEAHYEKRRRINAEEND